MRTLVVLLIVLGWGFGTGVGLAYLIHTQDTLERVIERNNQQSDRINRILNECGE